MHKFEVTAVTPRGYCQGVVRAIRIVRETAAAYPDTPVHMLGMIVHNAHVVAACRELGILCLEDPARTRLELLYLLLFRMIQRQLVNLFILVRDWK